MIRLSRFLLVLVVLLLALPAAPALGQTISLPPTCVAGLQLNQAANYLICMPSPPATPDWNHDLVIFAHGYVPDVPANSPPIIPLDQLVLADGTTIPGTVNGLGYAFAATSYRVNGLAVKDGVDDLVDLVNTFKSLFPQGAALNHVFLVGASEGGLITAKAIEEKPDVFSGGVAACGPIGDFQKQINYVGDFRVVFDYFFPGVLPPSAINIPSKLIAGWDAKAAEVSNLILTNTSKTDQLLRVTKAATDPAVPATRAATATGLLWYNVFGTMDARAKLGGQPFDNSKRIYFGSNNDLLLNRKVNRYTEDATAKAAVNADYQTTGRLRRPLATIHDLRDPIVPYSHEVLYFAKVLATRSLLNYVHLPIARYGHCNFTTPEILAVFQWVVIRSGGASFANPRTVMPNAGTYQRYLDLQRELTTPKPDAQPELAP